MIWSPRSLDDLAEIDRFLSQFDAQAAVRILRAIRPAVNRLVDYPKLGRAIADPFRVIGVRRTPDLIVYRLGRAGVEIVRIRHSREDWIGPIEAEF